MDDEVLARRRIKTFLASETDVEVIGECANGCEAAAAIETLTPDLLFLDIELPSLSGIEVLQELPSDAVPSVIFVTAHTDYTLQAFELHAIDYLLKPFSEERFRQAIARVRRQRHGATPSETQQRLLSLLTDLGASKTSVERLIVNVNDRVLLLPTHEIDWIEAQGNYALIHAKGKTYLLRETLNNLSARLDAQRFFRIHRSTLVNIERIKKLQLMFGGQYAVILHDGTELTLSRSYREKLLQRFGA